MVNELLLLLIDFNDGCKSWERVLNTIFGFRAKLVGLKICSELQDEDLISEFLSKIFENTKPGEHYGYIDSKLHSQLDNIHNNKEIESMRGFMDVATCQCIESVNKKLIMEVLDKKLSKSAKLTDIINANFYKNKFQHINQKSTNFSANSKDKERDIQKEIYWFL